MRRRLASLILPVLLAGLAVVLCLRLVDEARLLGHAEAIESGHLADAGVSGATDLPNDAGPPPFVPRPFSDFREVLEYPVFSPTRRPPVPVPVAVDQTALAASAAGAPDLLLHGVVAVGTARTAFLGAEGMPPRQVAAGDDIDGWRVEEIGPDGVSLRRDTETHLIRLDYAKDAP